MSILSQTNIDKLCMTGVYRCKPMLELLPIYKRDDPYWSNNWTFKVRIVGGNYYMCDTYYNEFIIEITDDNIDKFEFVFDLNDVEEFRGLHWGDYADEDKWIISLDSGGRYFPRCMIKKGATPIKERVVERLYEELDSLKDELIRKEQAIIKVMNDEIDLRYT